MSVFEVGPRSQMTRLRVSERLSFDVRPPGGGCGSHNRMISAAVVRQQGVDGRVLLGDKAITPVLTARDRFRRGAIAAARAQQTTPSATLQSRPAHATRL